MHLDYGGLVTIAIGIRGRATNCLRPVSGESLDMLGVEAVAERMGDNLVGHHPTMPSVGKTAQAVVTTRCRESLDMLGVEAVAERMGDNLVGHHPTMPSVGKTAQAV